MCLQQTLLQHRASSSSSGVAAAAVTGVKQQPDIDNNTGRRLRPDECFFVDALALVAHPAIPPEIDGHAGEDSRQHEGDTLEHDDHPSGPEKPINSDRGKDSPMKHEKNKLDENDLALVEEHCDVQLTVVANQVVKGTVQTSRPRPSLTAPPCIVIVPGAPRSAWSQSKTIHLPGASSADE